jgi:hypothetical protein
MHFARLLPAVFAILFLACATAFAQDDTAVLDRLVAEAEALKFDSPAERAAIASAQARASVARFNLGTGLAALGGTQQGIDNCRYGECALIPESENDIPIEPRSLVDAQGHKIFNALVEAGASPDELLRVITLLNPEDAFAAGEWTESDIAFFKRHLDSGAIKLEQFYALAVLLDHEVTTHDEALNKVLDRELAYQAKLGEVEAERQRLAARIAAERERRSVELLAERERVAAEMQAERERRAAEGIDEDEPLPLLEWDLVTAEVALERLTAHREAIEERLRPMVDAFDKQAKATLLSAFTKRGVDELALGYADAWSGNSLFGIWAYNVRSFYSGHLGILEQSRTSIWASGHAHAEDLAYIDRGMAAWLQSEPHIPALMQVYADGLAEYAFHLGNGMRARAHPQYWDLDAPRDLRERLRAESDKHNTLADQVSTTVVEEWLQASGQLRLFSAIGGI